jgi:hypothetical protein
MYLERRILAAIHKNDAYFDFSAIIGWKHLGEAQFNAKALTHILADKL